MLALSLRAVAGSDVELGFLTNGEVPRGLDLPCWKRTAPRLFPGETTLRRLTGKHRKTELEASAATHRVDVVLPLLNLRTPLPNTATIGWIPDFQYRRCPEFSPEAERQHHESIAVNLTNHATRILLSSRDALADLAAALPSAQARSRAIPFPSLFAFEPPTATENAAAIYQLPEKFLLVANQFWAHKNHAVLVDAAVRLRELGCAATFVCTGLPLDHRSPSNQPLSDLLQAIARAGVGAHVRLLGQVPFPHLVDLLRRAATIVQPSRSEGWSTTVQDALALGRPVLCSDLPVHAEQAPHALGFFAPDDAAALAQIVADHWPTLTPGPDANAEASALAAQQRFARQHGEQLLAFCREAFAAK